MTLSPGSRLGPYEVVSPLGAGGMGEVYKARDTRLDRSVAIKVLPAHVSADPERRARFEREAKTIAGLTHPHICTLYDVGEHEGSTFLVMEHLTGETLAERLQKGPLPLEQALTVATEIADALSAAHRQGVIHRDLKPGNVMLTKGGATLLDFGLAKLKGHGEHPAAAHLATAPTQSTPLTGEGMIVGTLQYMAPEQVEGKPADARTDLWALGAILYEMATGRRAFEGTSAASLITAIMSVEPAPVSTLQPLTPPALEFAVRKCLAKVPDVRWQSAGDLADQLKWVLDGGERAIERVPGAKAKARTEWLAWLVSGVLALALIAAVVWWKNSRFPEEPMYFALPFPSLAGDIAIAPNGRTVAVVAYWESVRKSVIWIYERGAPGARTLANTEGASYPFWSPDGRSLAFFADGKLRKLDLSGGPAQTLCEAPSGRGGTWNKDGVIVFAPIGQLGHGLYRVSASGGTPTEITSPDKNRGEDNHRWPMFLPDGKHFLYLANNVSGQINLDAIYEGSLDSNEKRFVVKATANAAYVPPGYLVFYRDKTLFSQRLDLNTLELSGEPAALLMDVQYLPRIAKAIFSAADGGLLLAQGGSGMTLSQPTWLDRKGNELGIAGKRDPDVYSDPFLSPDGKTLALSRTDSGSLNTDVWTLDLEKNIPRRFTFDPAIDSMAVWSPDGTQLIFASNHQRAFDLYLKRTDGLQGERLLVHDDTDKLPNDWSRDGKHVVYARGVELWVLTLPELKTALFLKTAGALKNGQFSPDAKWLAYASNESGRWEVYVTSFPEAQGKWQVSTDGGEQPRWRGDGKELFYLSSDGKMMAAPVTAGARFEAGAPTELFQASFVQPVATSEQVTYDVTKDGQRFLVNTQIKQAESTPISVVLNWTAKLAK